MRVVERIPDDYKGSGSKRMLRAIPPRPNTNNSREVGKNKKPKGMKLTGMGAQLGYGKLGKKTSERKSGPRKRGPSK
jgi:hypothetical protein